MAFDATPAARKVGIVGWQRQDRVQMLGEDDDRIDREWALKTRRAECVAQQADVVHEQIERRSARVTVKKNVPPGRKLRR